jgi:4-amino-4-deoxy-L-arabinose transferase-like glycosyltransferase
LLVGQILPVFSLLAPCEAGASAPSVRHRNYETRYLGRFAHEPARPESLQKNRCVPSRLFAVDVEPIDDSRDDVVELNRRTEQLPDIGRDLVENVNRFEVGDISREGHDEGLSGNLPCDERGSIGNDVGDEARAGHKQLTWYTRAGRADSTFRVSLHPVRIRESVPWGVVSCIAPILAATCIFLLVTRGRLTFFPEDSLFYSSAAETLLQRHQLATGIGYDRAAFEAAVVEGRLPAPLEPLTAWPPGYPLTIALMAWCTGLRIAQAALMVNLVSVIAIVLLVWWLGRRASGAATGSVAAMMIGLLPFFSATVREAMSEAQFTAFALSAVALLILWTEEPEKRAAHLYAACVFAAAATYTRYIGVSLAITVAVTAAYRLVSVGGRRQALHALGALGVYGLLIVPLAVRNLTLTGHLSGAVRFPSELGVGSNLVYLTRAFFDALPFVRTIVAGPLDLIVSASLLAVVTIGAVDRKKLLAAGPPFSNCSGVFRPPIGVLMVFVVVYCALVVALRSHASFEIIRPRLLFPALVVAVILAIVAGRFAMAPRRRPAVAAVWAIACAVATLTNSPAERVAFAVDSREVQGHATIHLARAHLSSTPIREHVLFADDFYALHFATAAPVYRLPPLASLSTLIGTLRSTGIARDLLFVIGPAGVRASLSEVEQAAYGRALDAIGVRLLRGPDYGVWCVSHTPDATP